MPETTRSNPVDPANGTNRSPQTDSAPLSVKEVAALLDLDSSVVYREIGDGRLSVYRVGQGRGGIRITPEAFDAYLAAQGTQVQELVGDDNDPPLRAKDVAAMLDLDVSVVYREIQDGRLKAYRVGRGRGTLRIQRAAFRAYLAARGIPEAHLDYARDGQPGPRPQ